MFGSEFSGMRWQFCGTAACSFQLMRESFDEWGAK